MKSQNKSQSKQNFRIDEITLVLIVAVIAVIVSVYDKNSQPNEIEAEKITGLILDDHEISFASNGIVDAGKLKEIQNMDYNKLKISINAGKDFCMYMEDGNGNVILSKGSSKLSRDGIKCRE